MLESDLAVLKTIFTNLKDRVSFPGRSIVRAELQELLKELVLTKTQKALQKKIIEGKFSTAEAQIMSREDVTKVTPELAQFKADYESLQNPQALGQILWDGVYAFLEQRNALDDLTLDERAERSFPLVIEAMLHHRSFRSLRSDKIYAQSKTLLIEVLDHLLDNKELKKYPTLEPLLLKANTLLTDPTKEEAIKELIQGLARS